MKKLNLPVIVYVIAVLLLLNAIFMALCIPVSYAYNPHGEWLSLFYAMIICFIFGGIGMIATYSKRSLAIKKRDGYVIVTFGWVFMAITGALPYVFSSAIPNFAGAFFETVSGFTTTGASVLNNIESIDKGILLWRSLTQWIGGMGFIVLTIAILPLLGIGGMQLFMAEAPGVSYDKVKPRIKDTALRLWLVYVGLTGVETILLLFGGMNFYDAINHSLTTMATGGFSTKNSSAIEFTPYIQYVIILFMFLAGTNFSLLYYFLIGQIKKLFGDEEFRTYLTVVILITVMILHGVHRNMNISYEKTFRDALFQVISLITTTGFVSTDYSQWTSFSIVVVFALMFLGGSAGSTAGGIKVVRHIMLFKNSFLELKRQLHPHGVIPVRLNGHAVHATITYNILAFVMIYLLIFGIGVASMSAIGLDLVTSLGATATSLGNIGPGLGMVGPVNNFSVIPDIGKWILSLLMLLGRLELFTILILFTPYFWRNY